MVHRVLWCEWAPAQSITAVAGRRGRWGELVVCLKLETAALKTL